MSTEIEQLYQKITEMVELLKTLQAENIELKKKLSKCNEENKVLHGRIEIVSQKISKLLTRETDK